MKKLYILDPDKSWCFFLYDFFTTEGFDIDYGFESQDLLDKLQLNEYDAFIMEYNLTGEDPFKLIKTIQQHKPDAAIILMSEKVSGETALKALKMEITDFITKPFNANQILLILKRNEQLQILREENKALKDKLLSHEGLSNIIGKSILIRKMKNLVLQIAPSDATVLVTGESGTGKELIAQAIHRFSKRKEEQMITINCAAIPEHLIESELFGYEKGSFTGATNKKTGLIEAAHKGTLFLDEIGELPLGLQSKLLRLLQFKEYMPIGSTKKKQADLRIIAATNKQLKEQVKQGNFREDLFYRLNVVPIELPSLKERKDDIPLLIHHFVNKFSQNHEKEISEIKWEFIRNLSEYAWPGNIRELENLIERIILLNEDGIISAADLPGDIQAQVHETQFDDVLFQFPLVDAKKQFEKKYILQILKKCKGNVSLACKTGKIGRPYLYKKMKEYQINHYKYKQNDF